MNYGLNYEISLLTLNKQCNPNLMEHVKLNNKVKLFPFLGTTISSVKDLNYWHICSELERVYQKYSILTRMCALLA